MIVGINASRARSGGAKAHLIGVLSNINPTSHGFSEVHIWSYPVLLNAIPDTPWLIKHSPLELENTLPQQIWWERFALPKALRKAQCSVLLNVDAGTVCRFRPSVTMSRDMLSYEPGEIERFGFSMARLRLILLRYVQNASLRAADGAIFLTQYAAKVIQQSCGPLTRIAFIPHGVGIAFASHVPRRLLRSGDVNNDLKCLYVSNVAPYKHQWHVVRAIKLLRERGVNVNLILTGGGDAGAASYAQQRLNDEIKFSDPDSIFTRQIGYVPQCELPALLAEADIFIFASSCENMPNTLVEAMAMGLPIACSDRGPMPEVLQDCGVYFDPERPSSIAAAIENLVTNTALMSIMASRAKKLSNNYSWARCAQETFSFLAEVAQTRKT